MEAIDVVGAGAIGATVGYALAAGGATVRFVEADPVRIAAGNQHGIRLESFAPLPVEFVSFERWRPVAGRCVLLCTKCYDNPTVLERLGPETLLVPIQNGLDWRLEAFPHVCAGIAAFVAEGRREPPSARITRSGPLYVGSRMGRAGHPLARRLAAALRRSGLLSVRRVRDIRPIQLAKLWYNAAIAPLAAFAGTDNAALLENPTLRKLLFALLEENYRILQGAGLRLGWLGPFPPGMVIRLLRRRRLVERLIPWFLPSLRGTYCSVVADRSSNRTELDYYTGPLLRLARQAGIPAPLNDALYQRLREWSASGRTPPPDWIDELVPLSERMHIAAATGS